MALIYSFNSILVGDIFVFLIILSIFEHLKVNNRLFRINMSNKRDLKRTINYICGDLFVEGIAASLYSQTI